MARLSIPMNDVENGSERSELYQYAREQEHQKAGHPRIRHFAFVTLQTNYFDCVFHDRTSDLTARNLRAVAVADVQTSA